MDGTSTTITYEQVRTDASTIQECAQTMQNIFESFGTSIKNVGAEDVYVGDAAESLGQRFNSLKTKFDSYVKLVNDFANMILGAAESTEKTEATLAQEADTLAN